MGYHQRNVSPMSAMVVNSAHCSNGDGVLSLGYSYPNQLIPERYSSAGSPYWAMKAFLPLALPASHPFWTASELPLGMGSRDSVSSSHVAGMVLTHQPGHTVLLISGPGTSQLMRGIPEKYQKFAYSTRYGFSVESDPLGFKMGAFDSMIALSDGDIHYRVRENCVRAMIAGDCLYSLWRTWEDIDVETWLLPRGAWHVRVHRIRSPRDLSSIEGAFAAPRTDFDGDTKLVEGGSASVMSALGDFVKIIDSSASVRANVVTKLRCAVLTGPDGERMQSMSLSPPRTPTVEECEELFTKSGVDVEICKSIE